MNADSLSEITGQSWGSRLLGSLKGILFGLILFIAGFPVLTWNEGRAVHNARALAEGARTVASVPADRVERANEGRLVYVTGEATTSEVLSDREFGIATPAIRLQRTAEMYEWQEKRSSHTEKKLGGSEQTVTTYTYVREWSKRPIDSSQFKQRSGHENPPTMAVQSESWTAPSVSLGAFSLPESLVNRMTRTEPVPADSHALEAAAADVKGRAKLDQGLYYFGSDSSMPQVGDIRVAFAAVRPATVSLVARQVGATFEPWIASSGSTVELLEYGVQSPDILFKEAAAANQRLTWILRGVGFGLMALGLFLILNPFAVLADVVPLIGSVLRAGIAACVLLLAATLSIVTIALAWVAYRPTIGIGLLILAACAVTGLLHLSRRHAPQSTPPATHSA